MSDYVLAVDVGGTKTLVGAIDRRGRSLAEWTQPTRGRAADDVMRVVEFAGRCLDEFRRTDPRLGSPQAVGAGFPEYVSAQGELTSHEVLTWERQPLDVLSTAFLAPGIAALPVVVESDVRLGALGEMVLGAGVGHPSLLYVSLGTGLSSAFVADGKVWAGARGEAIGLGERTNAIDGFPNLESYGSGAAISARFLADTGRRVSGPEVSALAAQGNEVAQHIVVSAGEAIGDALSDAAHLLDPHAIILGGGLGTADNPITDSLVRRYESRVSRRASAAPIVRARLGRRSGLMGGAVVAWRAVRMELSPTAAWELTFEETR